MAEPAAASPPESPAKTPARKRTVARKPAPATGLARRKTTVQVETVEPPAIRAESVPGNQTPFNVPPILMEGDRPTTFPASGPGQRYALGPTPPEEKLESEGELPDTYGTRQLLLAARDPYWLYAHWDLTLEQQRRYNALAVDRHLVLRVYVDAAEGRPFTEVHVHPESRHWFIHVGRAGTKFVAELGYYAKAVGWTVISVSSPTLTPPDKASEETTAEFATIPFELPLAKLVALVKEAVRENVPLAKAIEELRNQGHPDLPGMAMAPAPAQWTPAQERALAEVINMDHVRRVWMGSLEITELIRRQFAQELASMAAAQLALPTSPAGAISSLWGGEQPAKGFWFNVNAELIIYGATESTATVTVGGRHIRLRPDGSFSYRFALPDGQYELPLVAVSADQTDGRAAEMKFSRSTEFRGEVGPHPQDQELKRPEPQYL
jgi:hypothetical protein